ncbi:MAG: hypothetical protein E7271_04340 [Lachnospiraceae bacterium]|jgi:flagellar motility protein MotE (MotC chaperone)|nr:hypothetical protein [Lachnospiraceae bacterium]
MAKKDKEKKKENDGEGLGSKILSFIFIILIIVVWLAILCALIKLDVGGFGSTVLRPIFKDVPVIKMILPEPSEEELEKEAEEEGDGDDKIATLSQAKEMIKELEAANEKLNSKNKKLKEENADLTKKVERLQVLEDEQAAFQKQKEDFYNEIVYGENAPDADTYIKWYESINEAYAEAIYRQLVTAQQSDKDIKNLAKTYESMKPKEAATTLQSMSNDLDTVASIMKAMSNDGRAKIMNEMDDAFAASITKKLMP